MDRTGEASASETRGISRRTFIAAGAGAAALAATRSRSAPATPAGAAPTVWDDIRAQFMLRADITYMNNGSLGPSPRQVIEAARAARLRADHGIVVKIVPGRFVNGLRLSMHVYNSERDIAKLISALHAVVRS